MPSTRNQRYCAVTQVEMDRLQEITNNCCIYALNYQFDVSWRNDFDMVHPKLRALHIVYINKLKVIDERKNQWESDLKFNVKKLALIESYFFSKFWRIFFPS